jgi:hypothetical protein
VFWAVERKFHDAFIERLEGWWLRRCLKQLASADVAVRILVLHRKLLGMEWAHVEACKRGTV